MDDLRLRRLASVVSHLLNPAGLAFLVFGMLTWRIQEAWVAGAVGALVYAVVPGGLLVYLHRAGYITDLYPEERSERAGMLLVGSLCYFGGVAVLHYVEAPLPMLLAGCTFGCNALLVWFINHHWKISIHAVGVGGGVSVLLFSGGASLWPFLLALPLVAWARLHLRAHTPAQVTAGLLLGGVSTVILCTLFDGAGP